MRQAARLGTLLLLATTACESRTRRAETQPSPPQESGKPASSFAWWVTARFTPTDPAIDSVPVHTISPDWVVASVLSRDLLPKEAASDPSQLADSQFGFVQDGDFNHDGARDRAMVGVYRKSSGEEGMFLLILTKSSHGWAKSFLNEFGGEPGFSVLGNFNDTLLWSPCMECDGGARLACGDSGYAWIRAQAPE